MGRVIVQIQLTNAEDLVLAKTGHLPPDQVRRLTVPGVVDTGASYLMLSRKMAKDLGVPTSERVTVRYADQRRAKRTVVENVRVDLLGRDGIFKAIVEPKREEALIGAFVLEELNLLVDCSTQTVQPRDPTGIVTEVG
jgi:predicted aspartyl protease